MLESAEQLKVAFVGTSCIGKTTLVEAYRKRDLSGLVIIEEAAREFFTLHPEVINRFSAGVQGQVQSLALANEQRAMLSGTSIIICDRSVLDAPAYVLSQGDVIGASELLARVRLWLPTYTRLFLLDPSDVSYQNDAIRQESEQERWGFHQAFIDLFTRNNISYELLSGTLEQRMRYVDQVLNLS